MNFRTAVRASTLLLAIPLFGCSREGYNTTDLSNRLEVSPLYFGIDEGLPPIPYTATIGGAPAQVTWASSNPAVATVSAAGIVSPLTDGFAAITATLVSDPTKKKSASLTVFPLLGIPLVSGVGVSGIGGSPGAYILYRVYVPAGKQSLTVTLGGGTGDLDIYVQRATPPTTNTYTCVSWNAGNTENCTIQNPQSGTWYILVDVWTAGTGATLTATVAP